MPHRWSSAFQELNGILCTAIYLISITKQKSHFLFLHLVFACNSNCLHNPMQNIVCGKKLCVLGSILVHRSPLSLMSLYLFDNFFSYILNTFEHFIFLWHCNQLFAHPCSQSTRRRFSKLPFFYSSCPILPRKPVFISSLPSSREKHHPFFPTEDTGTPWVLEQSDEVSLQWAGTFSLLQTYSMD